MWMIEEFGFPADAPTESLSERWLTVPRAMVLSAVLSSLTALLVALALSPSPLAQPALAPSAPMLAGVLNSPSYFDLSVETIRKQIIAEWERKDDEHADVLRAKLEVLQVVAANRRYGPMLLGRFKAATTSDARLAALQLARQEAYVYLRDAEALLALQLLLEDDPDWAQRLSEWFEATDELRRGLAREKRD